MCSEPSVMASEPRSINDLPNEVLLRILSHFGPDDLYFKISKVSERWNNLAKDVVHFLTAEIVLPISTALAR